ncbi:hypothetical protein Afil01_52120 [Actinorhabdospora filicis]|uniref:SseB protein N-terminal domain-containing protein n=1 Tax=Actinorhabdospora filicis TaxID=1785913 RepID=A0A9W6WD29_9ACTN|nr:SseB family protein [Actinorhabdospora filicis]GLZ80405.1 hypothetical protein Afil01_52120 [Actinorhabdospora filicis]
MTWEPATDTERRMQDVLRQGDQESYFLLLSGVDLFIPVAPGNSAWATWSTEDRTHVLAFTSEAALRSCLREHAGQHRRVRLEELVHGWPDDEWWLAVNPGLPIEGYLPAWFVAQVAKGDVSLPQEEQPEPEPSAFGGFGYDGYRAPAEQSSFGPPPVAREDAHPELAHREFPRREPSLREDPRREESFRDDFRREEPRREDSFREEPRREDSRREDTGTLPRRANPTPRVDEDYHYGQNRTPTFGPAPEPVYAPEPDFGSGYAPEPDYRVEPAYTPEYQVPEPRVRAEDSYADYAPPPAQPEPERELPFRNGGYSAEPGYAPEPSYEAPAYSPEPPAYAPPEPAYQPEPPYQAEPASYQLEPAAYAPDAYSPPEPAYDAPDAYLSEPSAPSHGVTSESAYEEPKTYGPTGPGSEDVEGELAAAGAAGDTPRFLRALLSGWVYVPLNDGAPEGVRPGDPGFRWRTDLIDGAYSLTVFTSPTRMARRLGPCEFVKVTFVRVARNWPDRSYSLAINPGTEVGANMPGTQMQTLLAWADKKGLLDAAEDMERAADPYAGRRDESLSAGGFPPATGQQRKLGPTLMQKLIPAAQVPFYLQRGYDRVAGFVHPAEDLSAFDAPETLRASLGLPHDGASDVYVIRWISHRADLYRIPYGGNNEDEMRRMEGWVIEPGPFRGNGFAPGENGAVVAEFKVDSIRLPHGATMHRLSSIDGDTLVASYDADQQTWLTAEETL